MADERSRNKRSESGGALPPWLRGVPLPPRPAEAAPPAALPAGDVPNLPSAANTLPDWLRDLQGSIVSDGDDAIGEEPAQDTSDEQPDWLSRLGASPSAAESSEGTSSTERVPDWLQDLTSSNAGTNVNTPPQQPTVPPPSRVPEETTSWLRSLGDTPAEPEPEPPVLPPTPPSRSSRPPMRMPIGATDWLRSLGQETDPAAPKTRAESAEQSSSGSSSAAQPSDTSDEEAELPSWLTDISREEMERDLAELPSDEEPPVGAGPAQQGSGYDSPSWLAPGDEHAVDRPERDVPDWLLGADLPRFDEHNDVDANWMQDLGAESGPTSEPPSGDLPDWLRAAVDEQPVPDVGETPSSRRDETVVPNWLRGADDEPPVVQNQSDAQDELPAWLRGDDAPSGIQPPSSHESVVADSDNVPSWLNDAHQPPTMSHSSSTDESLPAWLSGTDLDPVGEHAAPGSQQPSSPISPPDTDDDAVPDWLRGVETEPPVAPVNGSDVPDWLHGAETEAPARSVDEHDVPDWLRGVEVDPALAAPADEAAVPDWLRSVDANPSPAVPTGDTDVPDWLRSEEGLPSQPDAHDQQPWQDSDAHANESTDKASQPAHDDVPPWLQQHATDSFPSASTSDAGLPAWLRGAETDLPPSIQQPSSAPSPAAPTGDDTAALPPWLRGEQEIAAPSTRSGADTQPPSGAGSDFFGGTDLPSWLRPPDAATGAVEAPRMPPPERQPSDWMAQLRLQEDETEDASSEAISLVPATPRPGFNRTPGQIEAVALLQRLIVDPFPAPAAAPAAEAPSLWRRMGAERLLYLLLLASIVIGLAVPTLGAPLQGPISAPNAQAIADQISTLSPNDVVLVAYEWDARRRSELSPLEQAVMQHLAQQKVKFVFVSTDLQGTLLSFDARDQLVNQFGYRPGGLDYILLGYKPGGELALRGLAQNLPGALSSDFQGADATKSAVASDIATGAPRLSSLNDFAMVLVMADEPQDVQAWMEQVHSVVPAKPFVFLLPAETTSVVQPYLQQPGVLALSGKNGALAYDQIRNGTTGVAMAASGQLPFAIIVFAGLLLIGALLGAVFTAIASRRRKRSL